MNYFLVFVWGNGNLDPSCVPDEYTYLIPDMQAFLDANQTAKRNSRVLRVDFHMAVKGVPMYDIYVEGGGDNNGKLLELMDFPDDIEGAS